MNRHIRYDSSDGIILDAVAQETNSSKAVVLMLHGINSDKDEGGLYVKLSEAFLQEGYDSFRFDFRSHGMSTGKQIYVTIAGETEDFVNTLRLVQEKWDVPVFIVAASFGTVSLLNSYSETLWKHIKGIILLNPVLNLRKTFLESDLPWPKNSFNPNAYRKLEEQGFFLLDNKLKIGKSLMEEIKNLRPYENLPFIKAPVLIIHGNQDRYVPYNVSKDYSSKMSQCNFITIDGADHGFRRKEEQDKVLEIVIDWVKERV